MARGCGKTLESNTDPRFVQTPRHRGTCYKAANWIHVGRTVGRGKKSRVHQQIIPIKDIWLYPLHKDFRSILGWS